MKNPTTTKGSFGDNQKCFFCKKPLKFEDYMSPLGEDSIGLVKTGLVRKIRTPDGSTAFACAAHPGVDGEAVD